MDLIERQKAIDALEREKSLVERPITETRWFDFGLRKAQDVLSEVPSAQPEQKWIPCSERLPEEYGNYLITTYDGNVDIGTIDPKGKSMWSACDADGFYWMRNVIAWMPLPAQYIPEGDDKHEG